MQRRRYVVLFALLGTLSAASLGQESPAPPQPAPSEQPAAAPPAEAPAPPPGSPPAAGASTAPSQPSEPQQRAVSDETFIPSEELSADEEVTFPVDI